MAQQDVLHLRVDELQPGRYQPRLQLRAESLTELAESIREQGVLQPLIVRLVPPSQAGQDAKSYEIVAGERRWRAAQLAGLATVPVMVRELTDQSALAVALIENLQREDLSPLDEAVIYKKMTDELGYSIRQLAGKLGKDKGYVENRLRLANAPDDVREMVSQRYDTLSAAYELMKIDNARRRRALAKQMLAGQLTLIKLHDRVERILNPREKAEKPEPAIPPLRDDALITATRKLNEALSDLSRAIGEDGTPGIPEGDRQNLAKFLTISRARLDNLVARLRSR